ncbi:hypothetical protein EXT68_23820 [Pectobacterium parmentieri]|nr:hypothetical protein [Pectobacterium parmentieri]
MAHSSVGPREVPTGFGKSFLIGGSIVAAGFIGTWYSLIQHKKREQAAGKNPYHEQIVARLSEPPTRGGTGVDLDNLKPMNVRFGEIPPQIPTKEHNSRHATIEEFAKSPDSDPEMRRMEPTPQKGRRDGSGKVYTKSPDFVDNYGKTLRARQFEFHPNLKYR